MRLRNLHRNSHRLWEAIPIAASDKLGTEEEQEERRRRRRMATRIPRKEMDFDIELWSFINIILGIKSWNNHSEVRRGE